MNKEFRDIYMQKNIKILLCETLQGSGGGAFARMLQKILMTSQMKVARKRQAKKMKHSQVRLRI